MARSRAIGFQGSPGPKIWFLFLLAESHITGIYCIYVQLSREALLDAGSRGRAGRQTLASAISTQTGRHGLRVRVDRCLRGTSDHRNGDEIAVDSALPPARTKRDRGTAVRCRSTIEKMAPDQGNLIARTSPAGRNVGCVVEERIADVGRRMIAVH